MKFFSSLLAIAAIAAANVGGVSAASNESAFVSSKPVESDKPAQRIGTVNVLDSGYIGCGFRNTDASYYATVEKSLMGYDADEKYSSMCGRCIVLHGKTDIVLRIIGECEGCIGYSLEISQAAFDELSSSAEVDLDHVSWEKLDKCPR